MAKIKIVPYDSNATKELEIIEIGKDNGLSSLITTPYRTDFFQIIWFREGNITAHIDFNKIEIEPDTILFLNKNRIQFYEFEGVIDADVILFTENFYNKSMSDKKYISHSLVFSDLVKNSFLKASNSNFLIIRNLIFDEYHNTNDSFQIDFLRNQLHSFVLLAERHLSIEHQYQSKGVDFDLYIQLKELLESKFKIEKSVQFYCHQMNVTEKRLNKAISTVLGNSSKGMINNRVILEAQWLLSNSNMNIKEIGLELGFSEPTNFIKYFKKHTSKTPSDFRIMASGGN